MQVEKSSSLETSHSHFPRPHLQPTTKQNIPEFCRICVFSGGFSRKYGIYLWFFGDLSV